MAGEFRELMLSAVIAQFFCFLFFSVFFVLFVAIPSCGPRFQWIPRFLGVFTSWRELDLPAGRVGLAG